MTGSTISTISTISTTIDVGVTLGAGGYGSPLFISNSGEVNATSASSSSGGAMGADAVYVPKAVDPGIVINDGTVIRRRLDTGRRRRQ